DQSVAPRRRILVYSAAPGLSRVFVDVMNHIAGSTTQGTRQRTSADTGLRQTAGRRSSATIGSTTATAAPLPKLWLAPSAHAAMANARPTPIGCGSSSST